MRSETDLWPQRNAPSEAFAWGERRRTSPGASSRGPAFGWIGCRVLRDPLGPVTYRPLLPKPEAGEPFLSCRATTAPGRPVLAGNGSCVLRPRNLSGTDRALSAFSSGWSILFPRKVLGKGSRSDSSVRAQICRVRSISSAMRAVSMKIRLEYSDTAALPLMRAGGPMGLSATDAYGQSLGRW